MAEGRMLKKEISDSKKLGLLGSDRPRVLYFMMLPHLDIEGRLKADPEKIKGQICTMLHYSAKSIQFALEALRDVGLILLYQSNGTQFLEYTRFRDFQKLYPDKESKTKIPSLTPEDYGELQRTPLKSKVKESKVKLSKDKGKLFILFDKFWEVYPRKVAKKKAQERWTKINPDEQLAEQIIAAVRAQKASGLFKEMDFTPHPATWLNAGRWTDQLPKEAEKAGRRRAEADVNARKQESERQEAAVKAQRELQFAENVKKMSDPDLEKLWKMLPKDHRENIERMRPDRKELFDKLKSI